MSSKKFKIPELTHQQILILHTIKKRGKMFARELVHVLKSIGHDKSGPAFYQFMDRLNGSNLVKKSIRSGTSISGQFIHESSYEISARGIKALDSVKEFYFNMFE